MTAIAKGDRVEHALHGPGTVVKPVGKLRVRVQFDALGALARTVLMEDLKASEERRVSAASSPGPRATALP